MAGTGAGMGDGKAVGWAILGAGPVAASFAASLPAVGGRVVCVTGRGPERAAALARAHGASVLDEGAALAHPDVAVVYVATPVTEHARQALAAIAAGKAVLVEKPFAMTAAEAASVRDAARAAGVFCMEALWTRFQPLLGRVRELLAKGAIGTPCQFAASFGDPSRPDAASSQYDPARGGGALAHRGIYGLSLARHLMGPVEALHALARPGAGGMDDDCALILRHASGALSTIRASQVSGARRGAVIDGTAGSLRIAGPIYRPPYARLWRHSGGGAPRSSAGGGWRASGLAHGLAQRLAPLRDALRPGGQVIRAPYGGNGYGHQAAAVMAALAQGRTESPLMPLDETVEIMALLDAARAQWARP